MIMSHMPDPTDPVMKRGRSFTLIEIAIVLFITALALSALIAMINTQAVSQRHSTTRGREDVIRVALVNFIARNHRLPCPAVPTLAPGAAGNGSEAATPGTCTGVPASGAGATAVATGGVPWVTLGLPGDLALDGYLNRFTYQVVLAATNLNAQTISGMKGAITIHDAGPGIPGAAPAGNQTNDCTGAGGAYNPCAAAAVVVSHGGNGFGAYTDNGIQRPYATTGPDESENADGDNQFVVKPFSDLPANPYDDIVLALTPDNLLSPLALGGSLKDFHAVVTAGQEIIKGAIVANAVQSRYGTLICVAGSCLPSGPCTGAKPCATTAYTYPLIAPAASPDTVPAGLGLSGAIVNDPWGQPMQYALTTSPIAAATNPGLVAFTLTSYGPDNAPGGGDDILLNVYVGELIGVFSRSGL